MGDIPQVEGGLRGGLGNTGLRGGAVRGGRAARSRMQLAWSWAAREQSFKGTELQGDFKAGQSWQVVEEGC